MSRTPDLKRHALWSECIRRHADSGLTIAQLLCPCVLVQPELEDPPVRVSE